MSSASNHISYMIYELTLFTEKLVIYLKACQCLLADMFFFYIYLFVKLGEKTSV